MAPAGAPPPPARTPPRAPPPRAAPPPRPSGAQPPPPQPAPSPGRLPSVGRPPRPGAPSGDRAPAKPSAPVAPPRQRPLAPPTTWPELPTAPAIPAGRPDSRRPGRVSRDAIPAQPAAPTSEPAPPAKAPVPPAAIEVPVPEPPPSPAPAPPLAEPMPAAASAVEPTDVPELIVLEDDASLAELLAYGLQARGYRFRAYRNGRDALRELIALDVQGTHPLVLLDVDLPGLDGYSVLDALQRARPGTYRVVFTTVHGTEEEQLRGLEAGALDYLLKPISLRVALEKIRRWVGR